MDFRFARIESPAESTDQSTEESADESTGESTEELTEESAEESAEESPPVSPELSPTLPLQPLRPYVPPVYDTSETVYLSPLSLLKVAPSSSRLDLTIAHLRY